MRRLTLALSLLVLLAAPSAALAADGDTTLRSCRSVSGTGGACATDSLLSGAYAVALSPDGKHAYATATNNSAVIGYTVNSSTGALTRIPGANGCVRDTPVSGDCQDGKRLATPYDIVISPDGKNVYVAAIGSSAVDVFDRNATTGKLTQKPGLLGCVSQGGSGGDCAIGRGLVGALALAVSANGTNVYLMNDSPGALVTFDRNAATGALTQKALEAGCVDNTGPGGANGCAQGRAFGLATAFTVSSDGRHLYAPSALGSNAILLFNRDTATGEVTQKSGTQGCISADGSPTGSPAVNQCIDGSDELAGIYSVILSPDAKHLYAITGTGILTYSRAADTGLLTFRSCVNEAGNNGCSNGTAVQQGWSGGFSPDGRDFAVTSRSGGGVAFLRRNPTTGALTQQSSTARCSTSDGSANGVAGQCQARPSVGAVGNTDYAGNGRFVYAGSQGTSALNVFERDFAPVCQPRDLDVAFNTTIGVPFSCSDPNGDSMTYSITRSPSAGQTGAINQGAAQVFYSPFNGFSGGDSFDYRATAGGANSNTARVDLSVAGPPPPPPGGGGTPPPSGPTLIPSTVTNRWLAFPNFTKSSNLSVNNLPAGATVRVTCKTKKKKQQKKGCPYKSKRVTTATQRTKLNLRKPFAKKRLPVGTKITITITAPNMIGKRITYTVRKRAVPKVSTRCLPPGGKASRCV